MKNFRTALICTFAFLALFGLAAQAQTAELPIRVHVPFAFQVGNEQFPAGDYKVYEAADRLNIVNVATGERGAFVKTATVRTQKDLQGALQFVRRDGKHILSKVWAPGLDSGAELSQMN